MGTIGFITAEYSNKDNDDFPHYDLKEGEDMSILADGIAFPARMDNNNGNTIVLGSTGSGKTRSIAEPKLLYTWSQSLVIPVTKRRIVDQYTPLLKSRGYEVIDLNLAHPERSIIGYDPMMTKKSEDELLSLATAIVGGESRTMQNESDPFWSESCAGCLAAIMGLSRYLNGSKSGFIDVMQLFKALEVTYPNGHARTSLDSEFELMEAEMPDSAAPRLWKTIVGTASRTASCISSILNNALARFCGEYGDELLSKKKLIDLRKIGARKTAVFVTTNSISVPCARMTTLLFGDLFHELFEEAEANDGCLRTPVHVLCDEFATGSPISGFAEHIAVFREAGVSCTILLQSLSQLDNLYGVYSSSVIQDNCDNLIYLGCNDFKTAREISDRSCLPIEQVLKMKPGDEIVIRRGVGSTMTKRFKIFEDPQYLTTIDNLEI